MRFTSLSSFVIVASSAATNAAAAGSFTVAIVLN